MTRTSVVTGAASGIGAAVVALLQARGDRVIGVDLAGVEVTADLATAAGRDVDGRAGGGLSGGRVDAVIANAGVLAGDAGEIVRVNYFGAVATLTGLRPLLAQGDAPGPSPPCRPRCSRATTTRWWSTALRGPRPTRCAWTEDASASTRCGRTHRRSGRWPAGCARPASPRTGPGRASRSTPSRRASCGRR